MKTETQVKNTKRRSITALAITTGVLLGPSFATASHAVEPTPTPIATTAADAQTPLTVADIVPKGAVITKVEDVKFTTRVVNDSALPKGVKVTIQEGKNGQLTSYTANEKVKGTNGDFDSIPVTGSAVTLLPVEQVVRQGTNTEVIEGVSQKTKDMEAEKKAAEQAKEADEAQASAFGHEVEYKSSDIMLSNETNGGTVTSAAENRAYAQSILSPSEFSCLESIVLRESGWSTTATNPSSGAYGVAQSLPASKMASAGADWRTNGKTQVNWMLGYVDQRYGGACAANSFWNANHWY